MSSLPSGFLLVAGLVAATGCLHGQVEVGGKRFLRAPAEAGRGGEWVLYEQGKPQTEGTRRWLTRKALVELQPGRAAAGLERAGGVVRAEQRGNYAVVEFAGGPDAAVAGADRLRKLPGVRSAEPLLARQWFRRFLPNDPLFAWSAGNPGYQWHLRNTGENGATQGIDVNAAPAWDLSRGAGVRIGIVDDGLELTHPDLAANVDQENDWDFNGNDDDPSPAPLDAHGTSCAGVAAARGNNGIGITGCAPEARLVGLRLIAEPTADDVDAAALARGQDVIAIKTNSWGPRDDAYGASGPGPLALAALQTAVAEGRGGKGTVFLWAAGNGKLAGDDSNYDGWANQPCVIAVSAVNDKGRAAWYSEPGSNILICAPSNGGKQGVTTTDRTAGDGYNEEGGTVEHPDYPAVEYTNTFGGTSSATPAVAGVAALMLQANPGLTFRDVQEILVRTAVQNEPYDSGWVTNGAGFHFHHQFGAGLVDARAAVELALGWTSLPPALSRTVSAQGIGLAIPDADEEGVSREFTVPAGENLRLEHVQVHVTARHPYAGNLEWRLTSPSGVTARLARARFNDISRDLDWTFSTTHFWGERSEGTWKLQVCDLMVDGQGTLEEAAITFQGTPAPAALPAPVITSDWLIVGREGWEMEHQVTASNAPSTVDYSGSLPAGLELSPGTPGLVRGTPLETGWFDGFQIATNASGTTWDPAYIYILAADPALSDALEQPASLKMVPFGYGDPFRQTATSRDGADAIETAGVGDEEYSGIEFTVQGPARLDFHWKVSSEKNADYLFLVVDGSLEDYISGEVDWTPASAWVGPGAHNIDIYYTKDPGTAKGADRGWIDGLTITPTAGAPPAITTQTVQAYQNVYFRHQLEAENAPSHWTADNLPAGLTLHGPDGLIYGSPADVGNHPVTVHASNDAGTGTATVILQVGTLAEGLTDALDAPGQAVSADHDSPWAPQWNFAWDGDDAARSGVIGNGQQSVMSTTVSGPCKVVFYWGVSSESGCDFLRFLVDGSEREAISGEVGWTRKGFVLPPGEHTLEWIYAKDAYVAAGLDAGFVDRFGVFLDADGDGMHSDLEDWFGTRDDDPRQRPGTGLTRGALTTLQFPTVKGHEYRIEFSNDLVDWTPAAMVDGTGSVITWTDANSGGKARRFYRVAIP